MLMVRPSLIRPMTEMDIPDLCSVVATAFTGRDGALPARYQPPAVAERLRRSLIPGGAMTLLAELGGNPVALAQYARSAWAASSWELMFAATRPDLQGKGFGHELVLARLAAVEQSGGGLVFVSARSVARWRRYGFSDGPFNPQTGATTMWRYVGSGR
jgi:predicted N-acetyltransferase YhbS